MASHATGQSRRSAYELGPLLEGGASDFKVGEYVLVRILEEIQVEGYVDNEALQMDQALSISYSSVK